MTPVAHLAAWRDALAPGHARRRRVLAALMAGQGRRRLDAKGLRALLDALDGVAGGVAGRARSAGMRPMETSLQTPLQTSEQTPARAGAGRSVMSFAGSEPGVASARKLVVQELVARTMVSGHVAVAAAPAGSVRRRGVKAAAPLASSVTLLQRVRDAMAAMEHTPMMRRPVPIPESRTMKAERATAPVLSVPPRVALSSGRPGLALHSRPRLPGQRAGTAVMGPGVGGHVDTPPVVEPGRESATDAPSPPVALHGPDTGARMRAALRRVARQVAGGGNASCPLASAAPSVGGSAQANMMLALAHQVEHATASPPRMAGGTTEIHMGDVVVHASSPDGQRIGAQVRDQLRRSVPALANTGQR